MCFCFQPIILVLLDIPPMLPVLDGVVMELQDCALPLLRGESGCVQNYGSGQVSDIAVTMVTDSAKLKYRCSSWSGGQGTTQEPIRAVVGPLTEVQSDSGEDARTPHQHQSAVVRGTGYLRPIMIRLGWGAGLSDDV